MENNIKSINNNAYALLNLFMRDRNFETYSQLANFLNIRQSAINGWLARDSVSTIQRHLLSKSVDVDNLLSRLNSEEPEKQKESLFIYPDKHEDEILKKREELKAQIEKEKQEKIENYKQTLSLLSETKNGFSKEFQYAVWKEFNSIKEAVYDGFIDGYWDDSTQERTLSVDKIDTEFAKLLKIVVDKDNLTILEA